jgi:hypothetical protein
MQGRCKGLTHYLFLVCRALIFKKNNFPAAQYNDTVQQEIKKDDFHINGDRPSSTNGGDSSIRRSPFFFFYQKDCEMLYINYLAG